MENFTGLICAGYAKTNEEYKAIIKKRIIIFSVLAVVGICAIVASIIWGDDGFSGGFVLGTGSGLLAAGVFFVIRNVLMLKSEDKIKADRLKNCDERNVTLSLAATRTTFIIAMLICYIVCVVFAFINPDISKIIAIIVSTSLLTYVVTYRIYSSKM